MKQKESKNKNRSRRLPPGPSPLSSLVEVHILSAHSLAARSRDLEEGAFQPKNIVLVHHVGGCFKRRALEKSPLAVASAIFGGDDTGHSRKGGGRPQGARGRDAKRRGNSKRIKGGSGKRTHKRGSFKRGSCSDSSSSSSSDSSSDNSISSDSGSDSDSGGGGGGGSIRDTSSPDYAQVSDARALSTAVLLGELLDAEFAKADKATKARGLQRAALIGLVPRSQALSSSTQALELEPHHRPPIAVQFLNNLTQRILSRQPKEQHRHLASLVPMHRNALETGVLALAASDPKMVTLFSKLLVKAPEDKLAPTPFVSEPALSVLLDDDSDESDDEEHGQHDLWRSGVVGGSAGSGGGGGAAVKLPKACSTHWIAKKSSSYFSRLDDAALNDKYKASFWDLDSKLRPTGRLLVGWHRAGRKHHCVNPIDKFKRLAWRPGDLLILAVDPNIRSGTLLQRARSLAAHANAASPPSSSASSSVLGFLRSSSLPHSSSSKLVSVPPPSSPPPSSSSSSLSSSCFPSPLASSSTIGSPPSPALPSPSWSFPTSTLKKAGPKVGGGERKEEDGSSVFPAIQTVEASCERRRERPSVTLLFPTGSGELADDASDEGEAYIDV